jgi:amino acid transporter
MDSLESTTPAYSELMAHKQVFLASTNSRAATVAMSTVPLVLSVCTSLNALAAGSRQIWSLARDQALPFSSWFRKVSLIGNGRPFITILILGRSRHWEHQSH